MNGERTLLNDLEESAKSVGGGANLDDAARIETQRDQTSDHRQELSLVVWVEWNVDKDI